MTHDDIRRQLETLRRGLNAPFDAARARGDTAEMARLEGIAGDIDDLLDQLALLSLGSLANSLTAIKARIDGHSAGVEAASDLSGASLARLHAVLAEIFEQSSEEEPGAAPADPAPPAVTGMAEAPVPPLTAPPAAPAIVVAAPPEDSQGRLMLSEAHLLALWKRSLFPVDASRITVFGLRGCRPVEFGGSAMGPSHEITLMPVNYRTMNCTLGHWHPGQGLAVFPGSTVPFGATVAGRVAQNGVGVNQMGAGRYERYTAGWHKRSEAENGHWALRQDCAISLQRTGDDADFDLADRWEAGRRAGDNIHCAFHMNLNGNIPDSRFSSAGCQTVAGTVVKGQRGSEQGPWRAFIEPFQNRLGRQDAAEYVLLQAEEAQLMIRTRYAGKSVILRFGSQGPLVAQLQRALNAREGAGIKVDGDFGPGTFEAVIAFQTRAFGPNADDGVVGPGTAEKLGMTLPDFDFDDAVSGGPGHAGPSGPMPGPAPLAGPAAAAVPAAPAAPAGMEMAFGALTRAKHGQAFNDKVIAIANRLRCDPNHLMAVMAFETGESFAPDQKNAAGSGATGLIQFMPTTAQGLGTTTAKLAAMNAIDQLDFVEAHIRGAARGKPLVSLSDVYMTVLLPSMVGKLESEVLFAAPSKAYDQNKGLDRDKDGRITKAEAAGKVSDKLVLGMKPGRFG